MAFIVAPGARAGVAKAPLRVIMIESMPVLSIMEHERGFRDRFAALGYGPERAELVVLNAEGDRARARAMLDGELARGPVDAVVAVATLAAQAAKDALRGGTVPMVFGIVIDPVAAGLVERLDAPSGTNITGRVNTLLRENKIAQVLRVLESARPGKTIRFGAIHTEYSAAESDLAALRRIAADDARIEFVDYSIRFRPLPDEQDAMLADLRAGIAALEDRVDFWWQVTGPLGMTKAATDEILRRSRHAIAYGSSVDAVRQGALLSFSPDFKAAGAESANLVDRILRGTDPGTIPVVAPDRFDIAINLTTAVALGLAVPEDLLELASDHVYR